MKFTSEKTSSLDPRDVQIEEVHVDHLPPGYFRSSLFLGSMTAIGMGLLSAIAGFAYAAPILGVINNDIGPSPNLSWVAIVYTLMIAVGLTIVGRFTDIFGRRYTFIGGAALGVVGSIVSATAPTINALIAGMTLIGLAASTQVSYFYVTAELIPSNYRFVGNAVMYIFATPGGAFSPAIANSAILHTPTGWRTCFYILIGYNAVALACWVLFYRPPTFKMKHQSGNRLLYAKKFDFVGLVLFAGGLLVFLMGLQWGGTVYPWDSAHVLGTLIAGGASLVAFVSWETFAQLEEPLVPIQLLKSVPWAAAVVLSGLGASLYYALAVVWPSMVTIIYPTGDTITDGMIASIVGAGWVAGEILSGFLAKPIKRVKWQSIVTIAAAGIFLACMATCTPDTKTRACVLLSLSVFLAGYVEGLSLTTTTLVLPDQQQMGSGCGFGGTIRFTITTIATAIYSVVLTDRLSVTVPREVASAVESAGLPPSTVADFIAAFSTGNGLQEIPDTTPSIIQKVFRAYQIANADAYRMVFYTTIAFCGAGIISALFLPNVDDLMTGEVATRLYEKKEREDIVARVEMKRGHIASA
ncbi:uncharacterized protein Z518_04703 [Rhinocladiella mackenziei CBS 650.93]|uniref:Major facilitator superfamily (MFS) profile domain-containing protein n=1 Tax=Rhinocladiella mackenziei CBS 650.93 TaxID=1442369 RepID=A0A0D2FWS2_9EURO|nr:uncharacterized protein Z518_04703 [Rhinocladiella mackenziei CBS 650.93]KIX06727.1 hypothetical protein Z518_04703 [Rhinocladiella mackenziei CBS 650.93]